MASKKVQPRKRLNAYRGSPDRKTPDFLKKIGCELNLTVKLPEGEDLNEWIAMSTVDFYNQIKILYGTLTKLCTDISCPVMCAGSKYKYRWADKLIKIPVECSAPTYVSNLMTWVQDQLDDPVIFPSKIGDNFPKDFLRISKRIIRRLFRVYAHVYHHHFHHIVQMNETTHFITSFKHFMHFVYEFNLIEDIELLPLKPLIDKYVKKYRIGK